MTGSDCEIIHVDAEVDTFAIAVDLEEETRIMCGLGITLVSQELRELIEKRLGGPVEIIEGTSKMPNWLMVWVVGSSPFGTCTWTGSSASMSAVMKAPKMSRP